MRLLPPHSIPGRVLVITVDLPAAAGRPGRPTDETAHQLCRVLAGYHVPVTWGVDDPCSAAARMLASRTPGHELALRLHSPAAGGGQGPSAVHRACGQCRTAQEEGLAVSTLLVRGKMPMADLGILARSGICMVATPDQSARRGAAPLSTLRFGMWRVSASLRIPGSTGVLAALMAGGAARRAIDRAIRHDELMHLTVDAAALSASPSSMRTFERVLRHVDRRRHQDVLEVLTLAEVARRLPIVRTHAAACSILRSRAA